MKALDNTQKFFDSLSKDEFESLLKEFDFKYKKVSGMKTEEFRIYVNDKLKMTCFNEFVAMNNIVALREKHGKDNVRLERISNEEKKQLMNYLNVI